jgi:hypothetical protein
LLAFMEYLTKWTVVTAIPPFDTYIKANVLLYSIILVDGVSKKWFTYNGANLIPEDMKCICRRLGINKVVISIEHP